MNRKITWLAIAAIGLGCSLSSLAEDKIEWYPGCFEVEGTTQKTTTVTVVPEAAGLTRFTVAFQDAKSNSGFAQFPLRTSGDFPAFEFTGQAAKDGVAEVWVEGDHGWRFQQKIHFRAGPQQTFTVELRETTSAKSQWMRVIFPNKENPTGNTVMLGVPKFVK